MLKQQAEQTLTCILGVINGTYQIVKQNFTRMFSLLLTADCWEYF